MKIGDRVRLIKHPTRPDWVGRYAMVVDTRGGIDGDIVKVSWSYPFERREPTRSPYTPIDENDIYEAPATHFVLV